MPRPKLIKERRATQRHLYIGWAVSYAILFFGVISLAVGLREEGIKRSNDNREASKITDLKICQKQNELRTSIRNFVIKLSDDPGTKTAVKVEFANVNCTVVTSAEGEK